jgi:hypothetical protein
MTLRQAFWAWILPKLSSHVFTGNLLAFSADPIWANWSIFTLDENKTLGYFS